MFKKIPLSQGKFALVDDSDFLRVAALGKWSVQLGAAGNFYAVKKIKVDGKYEKIYLHRFIIGATSGKDVDHINGDGLDNRQDNLRLCARGENVRNKRRLRSDNTSGFKGVSWNKQKNKWSARIDAGGVGRHLGLFDDKSLAADAYDRAASDAFGEFAALNRTRQ